MARRLTLRRLSLLDERSRDYSRREPLEELLARHAKAIEEEWRKREEEGETALQKVGDAIKRLGVNFLIVTGKTLDAPGNLVRTTIRSGLDLAQGRPVRGVSLWNTYTGRDLLRDLGLISDRDTWGNFFGGMAVEMALDPLTYLTMGGGKALQEVAKTTGEQGAKALVRHSLRTGIGKSALEAARSELAERFGAQAARLLSEEAIERGFVPYRSLSRRLTPEDLITVGQELQALREAAVREFANQAAPTVLPNLASAKQASGQLPANLLNRVGPYEPVDRLLGLVMQKPELARMPLRQYELGVVIPGRRFRHVPIPLGGYEPLVAAAKDRLAFELAQAPIIRGLRRSFVPSALGAKSAIVQSFGHSDMFRRDLDALAHSMAAEELDRMFREAGYEYPKEPIASLEEAIASRMLAEGADPGKAMMAMTQNIRDAIFTRQAKRIAQRLERYLKDSGWEELAALHSVQDPKDHIGIIKEMLASGVTSPADISAIILRNLEKPGLQINRMMRSITNARQKLGQRYHDAVVAFSSTPLRQTLGDVVSAHSQLLPTLEQPFKTVRETWLKQILAETRARGVNLENLANAGDDLAPAEYWPRYAPGKQVATPSPTSPIGAAKDPSRYARAAILRDMPGGTGTLMALLGDKEVIELALNKDVGGLTAYLKQNYGKALGKRSYNRLAKWIIDQPSLLTEVGFFASDPLVDFVKRFANFQRLAANADLTRDILVQPGVLKTWGQRAVKQGGEITSELFSVPRAFQLVIREETKPPRKVYLLGDLLNQLGYTKDFIASMFYTPEWYQAFRQYHDSAVQELLSAAQQAGKELTPEMASEKVINDLIDTMRNLVVDPKVAEDLLRRHSTAVIPSYLQRLTDIAEAFTNIFRGHATIMRPAFHVGNLLSGQLQSIFTRKFSRPSDVLKTLKAIFRDYLGHERIPLGTFKGLEREFQIVHGRPPQSAEELGEFLSDLARRFEVTGRPGIDVGYSEAEDVLRLETLADWLQKSRPASSPLMPYADYRVSPIRKLLQGFLYGAEEGDFAPAWLASRKPLLLNRDFWLDVWNQGVKENLRNLFSIRGAIDMRPYVNQDAPFLRRQLDRLMAVLRGDVDTRLRIPETRMPAARFGEALSGKIEAANRLVPFLRLLEEGYSPLAAAEQVGLEQVSYLSRHYTPFEKFLASWPIPFYKFNRGMLRFIARELKKHPAGPYAQLLRKYVHAQQKVPFVPDYLRDTLGYPIGQTQDSGQIYLTGLGLMPESALAMLSLDPADLARNILANASPIIRGPIEFTTGHSLWQLDRGEPRSLREIRPLLGSLLENIDHYLTGGYLTGGEPVRLPMLVESIAANSPFSSYLSMLRNITDYRKPVIVRALAPITRVRAVYIPRPVMDNVMRDRLEEYLLSPEIGGRIFERVYVPDYRLEKMSPEEQERVKAAETLLNILAQRAKAAKSGVTITAPEEDLIPQLYVDLLIRGRLDREMQRRAAARGRRKQPDSPRRRITLLR